MKGKITGVKLKVISKKECSLHEIGDEALVTETGVQGTICIHALYSVLPKAFAMLYGVDFPWLENPEVSVHACPDAANPLVLEVRRIREA